MKKRVVIGAYGSQLDKKTKGNKWRPTLSLFKQANWPIDRLELLYQKKNLKDVKIMLHDIQSLSPNTKITLHEIHLRNPWDFEENFSQLLAFAKDYPFDTENDDYLIHMTTGTHVLQICWFLLTESRHIPAQLLQSSSETKRGQVADSGSIFTIDLDLNRYKKITNRFQAEQEESTSFLKSGIATRNRGFNHLIEQIERVALRSDAPILLTGPTGCGKSVLANRIYQLKQSRHLTEGRFVAVNCAMLKGDNALSSLFGHTKGSFTGAIQARNGLLREAHKGILFLDEIAELGPDEQAMLLKAIEEKCFFPLGSDQEVYSDFQLIAGTHKNLLTAVEQGSFREDLFMRLNLWTFELPSLAERREDIEPNIDFELKRYESTYQVMVRFDRDARQHYLNFALSNEAQWRGNFRELGSSITRMATLSDQGRITLELVKEEILRLSKLNTSKQISQASDLLAYHEYDLFDRCQLETVIAICQSSNSISEAGRELFAFSRQQKKQANDADRLRKYLNRFNLNWEDIKNA